MKKIIIATCFAFLLSSCHKSCNCSSVQVCFDGSKCECGEWGEGANCTPMRNKFIGNFAGSLSLNGGAPLKDTMGFGGDLYPINYVNSWSVNTPYIKGFGIHMESSLTGIVYEDYKQRNVSNAFLDNFNPIDCGNAQISSDERTLTLIYHPVIDPGQIDLTNEYTFIGTKQ